MLPAKQAVLLFDYKTVLCVDSHLQTFLISRISKRKTGTKINGTRKLPLNKISICSHIVFKRVYDRATCYVWNLRVCGKNVDGSERNGTATIIGLQEVLYDRTLVTWFGSGWINFQCSESAKQCRVCIPKLVWPHSINYRTSETM